VYLEIFDVEHGACALITTSNGKRVMIDCGHNATTRWKPGNALRRHNITYLDGLCVTNYDEDHVSGYPNLAESVFIGTLFRNPSVQPSTIRQLKSEDGMGVGIERLIWSIVNVFTGRPPGIQDFGDTSFSLYWNSYGVVPGYFDDENNLSLVVFVRCGQHKFIFPGDMERAGWLALLRNPAFVRELRGVNVFVASHHGRENGYSEEVLNLCPGIEVVIISDKKMGYQS
jgi:beta-lactamase superfamily II metal-dependent hydrolase